MLFCEEIVKLFLCKNDFVHFFYMSKVVVLCNFIHDTIRAWILLVVRQTMHGLLFAENLWYECLLCSTRNTEPQRLQALFSKQAQVFCTVREILLCLELFLAVRQERRPFLLSLVAAHRQLRDKSHVFYGFIALFINQA